MPSDKKNKPKCYILNEFIYVKPRQCKLSDRTADGAGGGGCLEIVGMGERDDQGT